MAGGGGKAGRGEHTSSRLRNTRQGVNLDRWVVEKKRRLTLGKERRSEGRRQSQCEWFLRRRQRGRRIAVREEASCTAARNDYISASERRAIQGPKRQSENGRTVTTWYRWGAEKCERMYTSNGGGDGSALHVVACHEPAKRDSQLRRRQW